MLVDLLVVCLVLILPGADLSTAAGAGVLEATDEDAPGWLATVRHFSLGAESWTLRFRKTERGSLAVKVWWIEGPPVHTGMPAHLIREAGIEEAELPDHISARFVDLTADQCPALREVVDDIANFGGRAAEPNRPLDGSVFEFFLETPASEPIDLGRLAADDPAVRWARSAWRELSDCAQRQVE